MYDLLGNIEFLLAVIAIFILSFYSLSNHALSKAFFKIFVPILIGVGSVGLVYGLAYRYGQQTSDMDEIFLDLYYKTAYLGFICFSLGIFALRTQSSIKKQTAQLQNLQLPTPFADYYRTNIEPLNAIFEQKRVTYINSSITRIFITLLSVPVGIYLFLYQLVPYLYINYKINLIYNPVLDLVGILILCAGLIYWIFRPLLIYNIEIKSIVYPKIFAFFGKDIVYRYKAKFNARKARSFGIIPSFIYQMNYDEINGSHNGVQFYVVWSYFNSGNYFLIPRFKGIFMIFHVTQKFHGKTIVCTGAADTSKLVRLEVPQFDTVFNVYSSNQDEARTLVTTDFLNKLLEISQQFERGQDAASSLYGRIIEASFYDQKLLLKIDCEYPWFKRNFILDPCNFAGDAKVVLNKMQLVFDIIESLQLDTIPGTIV